MTILHFICARLDEVEAAARPSSGGVCELERARVERMREVVAEHECDRLEQICLTCRLRGSDEGWASETWPCPTVRQVAALWAEHPAYDAAWAPQPRTTVEAAHALPRRRRTSSGTWLRDATAASSV